MIKECLQEYNVQEIINKVHIFLLFLIYFSNILKYDVNIYLSLLLNYCRINGWEFCCKWDSSISSNKLFWLKWMGNVNECRTDLVKNLIKESFYGKRKKKTINILTAFFIFHKSDVKTFLKWILNQCLTALVNMTQNELPQEGILFYSVLFYL